MHENNRGRRVAATVAAVSMAVPLMIGLGATSASAATCNARTGGSATTSQSWFGSGSASVCRTQAWIQRVSSTTGAISTYWGAVRAPGGTSSVSASNGYAYDRGADFW